MLSGSKGYSAFEEPLSSENALAPSGRGRVRGGVVGGAGRWVVGGAFVTAAAYALSWPVSRQWPLASRLEFFLDLLLVLWGITGMLMMHFERARERVRELAEQELRLREQLERAVRVEALGRLAGGVAHDINNVLTIIINGTELVLHQLKDRPQAAEAGRSKGPCAHSAPGARWAPRVAAERCEPKHRGSMPRERRRSRADRARAAGPNPQRFRERTVSRGRRALTPFRQRAQ